MKKEKKNVESKAAGVLDLLAGICFFICACLEFNENIKMALTHIGLGVLFLGMGVINYKKYIDANKDEKDSSK